VSPLNLEPHDLCADGLADAAAAADAADLHTNVAYGTLLRIGV